MYTITLTATCDEVKDLTELTFQLIQLLQSNAYVRTAEVTSQNTNFSDDPPEPPPEWSFDGYDNYPGKPL